MSRHCRPVHGTPRSSGFSGSDPFFGVCRAWLFFIERKLAVTSVFRVAAVPAGPWHTKNLISLDLSELPHLSAGRDKSEALAEFSGSDPFSGVCRAWLLFIERKLAVTSVFRVAALPAGPWHTKNLISLDLSELPHLSAGRDKSDCSTRARKQTLTVR